MIKLEGAYQFVLPSLNRQNKPVQCLIFGAYQFVPPSLNGQNKPVQCLIFGAYQFVPPSLNRQNKPVQCLILFLNIIQTPTYVCTHAPPRNYLYVQTSCILTYAASWPKLIISVDPQRSEKPFLTTHDPPLPEGSEVTLSASNLSLEGLLKRCVLERSRTHLRELKAVLNGTGWHKHGTCTCIDKRIKIINSLHS